MLFGRRQRIKALAGKQVSVILKRQVPIRFDEAPRSWLGGLPMMPKQVTWPRDAESAPLQFVAQIACADLPPQLWDGLGPRSGWLLLFVEVLKLDDGAEGGAVQVLHIDSLGPEREPPEDAPTVRHVMSDYIDYAEPNIRPGVPKMWRRWPVDVVVQEYEFDAHEQAIIGSPFVPAEDLYNAPVSDTGIVHDSIKLDRPLTWRGALYFVEGIARDLNPADFERNFVGNKGGLIDPPESDPRGFNDEFRRRLEEHKAGLEEPRFGWGAEMNAFAETLKTEMKAERRTGWIARAYPVIAAKKAEFEKYRHDEQRKLDEAGDTLSEAQLKSLTGNLQYRLKILAELEEHRQHLDRIVADYPGPDGEEALNAEIRKLGEAHLVWGAELKTALERQLDRILAQDLEAALPESEWNAILESFRKTKSVYWQKTYDTMVLRKTERGLHTGKYLEMAVREDVLDIYTRNNGTQPPLPRGQLDDIERQLRYVEKRLPHRMGGQANPVQGEADITTPLLFQIASDRAMGWMWGDLGALYVTVSPKDLRRNRFGHVDAWIEGH